MEPRRGQVAFSSKNPTPILNKTPTPELPLLEEAASELAGFDDFDLLPTAAMDCQHPWGVSTPATTLPASPEVVDSSEEQVSENDHEETHDAVPFWPDTQTWPQMWAEDQSCYNWAGVGQGHGFRDEATGVFCLPSTALPQTSAESYIPMWCLVENTDGLMRVTPCLDAMACNPPDDDGTYMNLWCWTRVEATGETVIVPCTDKNVSNASEQPDLAWLSPPSSVKAIDASEGAPEPPPQGAYVPEWVSGPVWPFNAQPTTLKLSGLPRELTQEDLLEILDREEFNGYYDFVYLPEDVRDTSDERYATINLTAHKYGLALAARLHGKKSWGVGDGSCSCTVTWSMPYQGLADLARFYRDKFKDDLKDSSHLHPQIFSRGWPVPFPSVVTKAA